MLHAHLTYSTWRRRSTSVAQAFGREVIVISPLRASKKTSHDPFLSTDSVAAISFLAAISSSVQHKDRQASPEQQRERIASEGLENEAGEWMEVEKLSAKFVSTLSVLIVPSALPSASNKSPKRA